MSDVFISHVEEDAAIALEIARGLNAAGYTTWCYEDDSNPGRSYLEQIGAAIEACQAVLIVISPESLGSDQVTREIEYSHEARKRFIPVLKGISHVEFQNRRASWRVALGTTASIPVPPAGASAILPRIIRGLQGLGVKPAERECVEAERLAKEKAEAERKNVEAVLKAQVKADQERLTREKANSERRPKAPPVAGEVRENPKDGLKYVWIPPGTFMMGCSPGDTEAGDNEKPPHQVTITKGFWLGQTVVTVGAYKRFAAATGKAMPDPPSFNPNWSNEQMPIVNVNWDDAQAYCAWAGGRLPTEAEWEYAARAGSAERRYGDLDEIAWYADNSGRQRLDSTRIWNEDEANYAKCLRDNGNATHEVAQKRANRFGLYDMLGNVYEWVNDRYDNDYYQNSPSQDPTGPATGEFPVLRGGSWYDNPWFVRVSDRLFYFPGRRIDGFGFRCGGEVFGS
jgi:formylglycine-generating enzyme required for sulfatase activity